jgi:hypothetical protein
MRKRVTKLTRRDRRHIDAVKKSLRNYVDIVINSGNEPLIRMLEKAFEKTFEMLVQPKDLHRKKGRVIPIRRPRKNHSGE